jgi:hypothetical protein
MAIKGLYTQICGVPGTGLAVRAAGPWAPAILRAEILGCLEFSYNLTPNENAENFLNGRNV